MNKYKQYYLGTCLINDEKYSVLMVAYDETDACNKYFECLKRHPEASMIENHKENIGEVWFIDEKDIHEIALNELQKYESTIL